METQIPYHVQEKINMREKFTDNSFPPTNNSIGTAKGKDALGSLDW